MDPLVPTNKIKFKHSALKCAEWVIEKFGRAGNRTSFSLERFSYVLFDQLLVIQDLLLGIKKEFTPLHANQTIRLLRYIHLATNRGFMLFETSNDVRVSIVDVHLESDKFRFTGNSHSIFRITTEVGQAQNCVDDVSLLAEDIISVKVESSLFDDELHLFKVDDMLSTLDLVKTFTIPDRHSQWFTKIGNEIVFARFSSVTRFDRVYLDNFLALQEDGTLIEHENTETCLQAKRDTNDCLIYPAGIQACFFNGQFYILVNFYPGDRTLPSTVFLSVFNYKRKEWSEIVLDLPRISECYMKFNVNHGILALLRHIEEYEDNAELKQTNVTAYRIPLSAPEMLLNLSWFKAQECGILTKIELPFTFPFTSVFD